jgi:hypothetical protein
MGSGITPELSLELRVRWIEALVNGVKNDRRNPRARTDDDEGEDTRRRLERKNPEGIGERGETIARKLEEIQARLNSIVEQNETMKLFLKHCKSSVSIGSITSLTTIQTIHPTADILLPHLR